MSRLVDPLPPGAFTIGGKTAGPAVNMGRNRYNKSQLIFLGEADVRVAVAAFADHGFANPETHQAVVDDLAAKTAELDQAQAAISELEGKLATLEETVGFKTHVEGLEEKAATADELVERVASLEAELAEAVKANAVASSAKSKPKRKPKSRAKGKGKGKETAGAKASATK